MDIGNWFVRDDRHRSSKTLGATRFCIALVTRMYLIFSGLETAKAPKAGLRVPNFGFSGLHSLVETGDLTSGKNSSAFKRFLASSIEIHINNKKTYVAD